MKRYYFLTTLLLSLLLVGACGGSDGGGDDVTPPPTGGGDDDPIEIPDPASATLIFPEDDSECNEGEPVNDIESIVTFQSSASENTDSYSVTITNLNTGNSFNTVANTNEAPITILRGTPYEWSVTSRANGTNATAQSSAFRFYNEGPGIENYAPFPAEAINPTRGATLGSNTTTVTLEWSASDVDGDIMEYDVFFGLQGNSSLQSTTTATSFEVSVVSGNIYEWSIDVVDSQDNASTSETFLFRVDE